MVLSRRSSVVIIMVVILFMGFNFPQPIRPIYESALSEGMTLLHSKIIQEEDCYTVQLDLYQIDDADLDMDYYYMKYYFEDLKYGADAAVSPCLIQVEISSSSLGAANPTLDLLLSYRNPDPGWVTEQTPIGVSAGRVFFQYKEESTGNVWARWNITGTGGWPLLVHVAYRDFTISLGFRVGEMEGIRIEALCNITWISINRILGLYQHINDISLPIAEVKHEP